MKLKMLLLLVLGLCLAQACYEADDSDENTDDTGAAQGTGEDESCEDGDDADSCEDENEQIVTCKEAMDNFYDVGCAIFFDGDAISESEAVEECEEMDLDAQEEGCALEWDDLKNCFAIVEDEDCDDCDGELEDFFECMN